AMAAAKSPPDTLPKAKGKLLGPKTQTGPSGPKQDRIPALVSIVAIAQSPDRQAAAAARSWLLVRGSSTSASRGVLARPVSEKAASTKASLWRSIASA